MSDIGSRTLAEFITLSKDGECGNGEPFADSVQMRVIRGTDFDSVRAGDRSCVPTRYVSRKHAELKALQDGDLLIETAGGSPRRLTGANDLPTACGQYPHQNRPRNVRQLCTLYTTGPRACRTTSSCSGGSSINTQRDSCSRCIRNIRRVARFQWTTCLARSSFRPVERSPAQDRGDPLGVRRSHREQQPSNQALGGDGPADLPRVVRRLPLPRARGRATGGLGVGPGPAGMAGGAPFGTVNVHNAGTPPSASRRARRSPIPPRHGHSTRPRYVDWAIRRRTAPIEDAAEYRLAAR